MKKRSNPNQEDRLRALVRCLGLHAGAFPIKKPRPVNNQMPWRILCIAIIVIQKNELRQD